MLRVERHPGGLTVVSRFAPLRAAAVLCVALAVVGAILARGVPLAAAGLVAAATLLAAFGARAHRARFEGGSVAVRPELPVERGARRPLAAFQGAGVETFAEARRRRAERLALGYAARSGTELPAWLRPPDVPSAHDRLRRIVLLGPGDERLAVTAWLGEREDLEAARLAIDALLR